LVPSTWNYQYDAIGNSVQNKKDDHVITYNAAGLVMEVRNSADLLLISYGYSGDGKRVRMTEYDAAGVPSLYTWYAGSAVYEQVPGSVDVRQVEVSIGGGSGRLGVMYRQMDNTSHYALKDHLGNVRATFKRDGTLEEWTDYEPWGLPMEGRRQISSLHYRYAFQGQETEKIGNVTTTAFELRMWDARIGRWIARDPYRQFWSPYVGMGNNPVSMIDPDGGWAGGPGGIRTVMGDWLGNGVKLGRTAKSTLSSISKVANAVGAVSRSISAANSAFSVSDQIFTPPGQQSYNVSPSAAEQPIKNRQWGQVPDAEGPNVFYKQVFWTVNTSAKVIGPRSAPKLQVSTFVDPIEISDGSKMYATSTATLYNSAGDVLRRMDLKAPQGAYYAPRGYVGAAEFDLVAPNSNGLLPSYRVSVTTTVQVEAHGSLYTPTIPLTVGLVPNPSSDSFIIAPRTQ
jgi:RHS repeat-associated protein